MFMHDHELKHLIQLYKKLREKEKKYALEKAKKL